MSNTKTRVEKIRLLKDIASGKTTIDKAFPQPMEFWYCDDGKTYTRDSGDEPLTEEEFNSLPPYRGIRLVMKLCPGCDPIID